MSISSARKAVLSLTSQLRQKQISSNEFLDEFCSVYWEELDDRTRHEVLLEALSLIDDDSMALCDIGILLDELEDFENEIVALEKCLDIDAYYIDAWETLADCYFELDQWDKCLEACEFGIAVDPTNYLLHFYKGHILFLIKKQSKEAIESFEICKKYYEEEYEPDMFSHPDDDDETRISTLYDLMSQCYTELEETDKAIECYEKLMMREPNHHELYYRFSKVLMEKGDLPRALEMINKAIRLNRKNPQYVVMKSSIQVDMHEYEGAYQTMERLCKIEPNEPKYSISKACMAWALKKKDLADQEYRRALCLKPTDPVCKKILFDYFTMIADQDALNELDSY